MTKQCKLEQSSLSVLGFLGQIPVLAEVGKALQRHLLPFKFGVSQLQSAFCKAGSSQQQSNLLPEEGQKQFPLPILLVIFFKTRL